MLRGNSLNIKTETCISILKIFKSNLVIMQKTKFHDNLQANPLVYAKLNLRQNIESY